MDKVPTLAEVDLPADAEAVTAIEIPTPAETQSKGLFAQLLSRQSPLEAFEGIEPPSNEAMGDSLPDADTVDIASQAAVAPLVAAEVQDAPPKNGLFSFLKKEETADEPEVIAASLPVAGGDAVEVQTEAQTLAAVPEMVEEPKKDALRKGLFGTRNKADRKDDRDRSNSSGALFGPRKSKVVSEVAYGTTLPYGDVKRICGLTKRQLGKRVSQFPEKRGQYEIYDSEPGNTAPHTFYLTGFDDGCARQFTAALAMFGSVEMHEQLRYGLPSEVQPYSRTDKAYEELKSKVCRVPRQKPCGAKVKKIEKDTVFVSIYERFGGNARWSNLLLHDGDMIAHDMKGG